MEFTHAEVKNCFSFGREDLGPNLGPYTLANATGIPERDNFSCHIVFGDNTALFAYPDPETTEFCFDSGAGVGEVVGKVFALVSRDDWDHFDELCNRLIHLTGIKSLEEQGFDTGCAAMIMEHFWQLEGTWMMCEGEMILIPDKILENRT